ncbi:MAG: helix-turn-helix transcriptional regulator [Planctomycetaceae bacterium]|nr:helix-turn-helix transcriptional regulator [Planctomycetaceae bacterium]
MPPTPAPRKPSEDTLDRPTLRRRIVGKLSAAQAERMRQSTAEAEAEIPRTRAASRARQREVYRVEGLENLVSGLRQVRLVRGLQANTVAEAMEMDTGNYARLESGQTNPTLETLLRLAKAVGVEVQVTFTAE